jgi:hypothetical protein
MKWKFCSVFGAAQRNLRTVRGGQVLETAGEMEQVWQRAEVLLGLVMIPAFAFFYRSRID